MAARTGGTPSSTDWTVITNTTRRGFTGHEMLDNLNLVHMNGRVYDNVVGRFISADPYVQAPTNTQSFNRYSYALNNPVRYTDPSGYITFDDDDDPPYYIPPFDPNYDDDEGLPPECQNFAPCQRPPCRVECGQNPDFDPEIRPDSPTPSNPPRPVPPPQAAPTSQATMWPPEAIVSGVDTGETVLASAALPLAGRAAARNPYILGGAVVIGGALSAVLNYSQTAGFLRRPDYMSGPEYVPPSDALKVGEASSPGDPNHHDPEGKRPAGPLKVDDSQLGRKFGEHMDANLPGYRNHAEYRALAQEIYANPAARVTRHTSGHYAGETHYQVGNNLLRIGPDGSFRSLYPLQP